MELLSGDLYEKMTSRGYKREQSKKQMETVRDRADNLFHLNTALHRAQPEKIGTHCVHVSTAMLTKCVGEGMGRTYQK